jgi:hypothetical protein
MADRNTRKFFIHFLEQCQKGDSVIQVGGKAAENPLMSKEEADLRLALYDKEIEATLEIELELAQYEAMRWPKSKKASARVWILMEELKQSKEA